MMLASLIPRRALARAAAAVALMLAAGCQSAPPVLGDPVAPPPVTPPSAPPIRGEAIIESVRFLSLEAFPVEGFAYITGYTPDAATQVDQVIATRQGNRFEVSITTVRPRDAVAATVLVPFERRVPLDLAGLPRGHYTVASGDQSASFTLVRDNHLP
ncbi:hypothetical protein BH23VER1_BH23VER1_18650 [soil metagenome]